MRIGDTFLIAQTSNPAHLWVVVGGPAMDGRYAVVSLTSLREGIDPSCVLKRGDHVFVRHDTGVDFARGQLIDEVEFEAFRRFGSCSVYPPLTGKVLRRIQEGAVASDFTPQKVAAVIRETLG